MLARDKHSTLLRKPINYGHKKFYDTGPRSGLLIICSCDHLKHHNSQGSVDGNFHRNCQKIPNFRFSFSQTVCICPSLHPVAYTIKYFDCHMAIIMSDACTINVPRSAIDESRSINLKK